MCRIFVSMHTYPHKERDMARLDAEQRRQVEVMRERRRQAVERMVRLEVEDPPDAATLARELEAAHEPGGLD